ncbi:MAG: hypothetical protein H0X02_08855 [Nitrosomonas sp.]|nr:hypothetical protein [Nitrosomonas sp.]
MTTPSKVEAVSTSITPVTNQIPQDLVVLIYPNHYDFSEYWGTSAMLEDEGVIPEGTEWKEGYFDLRWVDEKFRYWLRRQRPPEAKGPRKQFENVDWFCFRWERTIAPSHAQKQVNNKIQEIKDIAYLHSAKGAAERQAMWDSFWKAERDKEFQDFKALIPGLIPIKRGRKTIAK